MKRTAPANGSSVPARIALRVGEAAECLGLSEDAFREHVQPHIDRFAIYRCLACGGYAFELDGIAHDETCPDDLTSVNRLTVEPIFAEHVDPPAGHPLDRPAAALEGPAWTQEPLLPPLAEPSVPMSSRRLS